jgi:hypothetical protein
LAPGFESVANSWHHVKFPAQSRSRLEPGYNKKVVIPQHPEEMTMGFGRGALLWLIGIPLPIIIILALFMHH